MSCDSKTRVFFLFHGRFPSEKAAAIFQDAEADSFSDNEREVVVVAPARFGRTSWRKKKSYHVAYVPTLDLVPLGFLESFFFRLSLMCFSVSATLYLFFRARKDDIIISNESVPLLCASFFFRKTLYEMHDYPEQSLRVYRLLFSHVQHILITTKWKLDRFKRDFPSVAGKAFYQPNAVDVEMFASRMSRKEARQRLNLEPDAIIAVYTGHLYAWKGVDVLAEAVPYLRGVQVYVVGGTENDVARFKDMFGTLQNLHIVGCRPHEEMPLWQRAADVLVLPNTAKEVISTYYTSPMKLFEYMASGAPIVASDIPSIRELVENRVILVPPDSAAALAEGVQRALKTDIDVSASVGWAQEHSWSRRAERMRLQIFL